MIFCNHFQDFAKARMMDEFYSAGHTSVEQPEPDTSHPLHDLFLETQQLLSKYCPVSGNSGVDSGELDKFRGEKYKQLLSAKSLGAMKGLDIPDSLQSELLLAMPRHAEILALRFATQSRDCNIGIIKLLTECNALHLWQVPRPANTEARIAVAGDDSQASNTDGTPTEPDSTIEAVLKAWLADAKRKVSAIQDTKRDLTRRLAVVEEAETAMKQAQRAMKQAQSAIEKSGAALLRLPMGPPAMDN